VTHQTRAALLPAELEAAVQAAMDGRRDVLTDLEVERVLLERPAALGPLLEWLATLEVFERERVERAPIATAPFAGAPGLAVAAGWLVAAGLTLLATQLVGPSRESALQTRGPVLEVHDFSITSTRAGPAGSTRLVNHNGHLARHGQWNPLALNHLRELPSAVHVLKTHTLRRIELR